LVRSRFPAPGLELDRETEHIGHVEELVEPNAGLPSFEGTYESLGTARQIGQGILGEA